MFHAIYVIWFLLPLLLLGLAAWAVLKPVFGVSGREDSGDYLKQGLFCLVGFGIALLIDSYSFDEFLLMMSADSQQAVQIVHWLLYPAVLLVMSYIHKLWQKSVGKDLATESNYGMARYKR